MNAHTHEEYATLKLESNAAAMELRRVFHEGTASEYKMQAEVARVLSEKLASRQEEQMMARTTIRELEAGPLAEATATHDQAMAELAAAKAALVKAKQENLTLRPRPVFVYPTGQSVSAIEPRVTELISICSICSKGFVANAAILNSCGCLFHNICVVEMIDSNVYKCPLCDDLDLAWVAQFDGKLDEH